MNMKNLVLFGDSLLGRFGKDLIVDLETKLPNLKSIIVPLADKTHMISYNIQNTYPN